MSPITTLKRGAVGLFAASVMAAGAIMLPSAAMAAATTTLNPDSDAYAVDTVVEVNVTGLDPNTAYRIGQCTTEKFSFGVVPGCALKNMKDNVASDANGNLTTTIKLVDEDINAHGKENPGIGTPPPGQPDYVDFTGEDSSEIMIAKHVGGGVGGVEASNSRDFSVN